TALSRVRRPRTSPQSWTPLLPGCPGPEDRLAAGKAIPPTGAVQQLSRQGGEGRLTREANGLPAGRSAGQEAQRVCQPPRSGTHFRCSILWRRHVARAARQRGRAGSPGLAPLLSKTLPVEVPGRQQVVQRSASGQSRKRHSTSLGTPRSERL